APRPRRPSTLYPSPALFRSVLVVDDLGVHDVLLRGRLRVRRLGTALGALRRGLLGRVPRLADLLRGRAALLVGRLHGGRVVALEGGPPGGRGRLALGAALGPKRVARGRARV